MNYNLYLPTDKDILMGQSPNLRTHHGNALLKKLVTQRFEEYCNASKLEKTRIAKEIIDKIHNDGGRFLKQPEKKRIGSIKESIWVLESDPVRIRDKVASQFRGLLKEGKRKNHPHQRCPEQPQPRKEIPKLSGLYNKEQQESKTHKTKNLPLKKRKIKVEAVNEFKTKFGDAWSDHVKASKTPVETNTVRSVSFDDLSSSAPDRTQNYPFALMQYHPFTSVAFAQ